MGWVALIWAMLMFGMGIGMGAVMGRIFAVIICILTMPPLWDALKARGHQTYALGRWIGALLISLAALTANAIAFSETPEGKAAAARRIAEKKAEAEKAALLETRKNVEKEDEQREKIASGEHCLSSWDGSFQELKDATRRQLRNPRSFEHVQTVRSPVDKNGKFGLIMTYRAENGFGGTNVEAIGVEVDAETCRFKRASTESLARRLH